MNRGRSGTNWVDTQGRLDHQRLVHAGGNARARLGSAIVAGLAVGALAIGLLAMAALGPTPSSLAASAPKPVTVTFWNWWDGDRATYMKTVIDHFNQEYPWIKIDSKVQVWTGLQAKIMTAFAAGIAPEVMMAPRAQVLALADLGAIVPITKYIQRDQLDLNMFYPAEVEAFRYRGEQWTLPLPTTTANDDFYFYNTTPFDEAGLDAEKPPMTWSSFVEVGLKLNRKDNTGKYTQLFVLPGPHMYLDFLFSNAGYPVTSDLRREAISSVQSKEALNYLYQLATQVAGPQAGAFVQGQGGTNAAFASGKLVTLFENVSLVGLLLRQNLKDWSVGLLPYNEKNPQARPTGVAARGFGWGYVIPKGLSPEKEEAAWKWVKFLTTAKYGTGYFSFMMGRPSPVKYWNENPEYRKVNPAFDRILAAMATDRPLPSIPVVGEIVDAIVNNLWGVAGGTASPVDAGNSIAQKVQNILNRYWASSQGR